MCVFLAIGLEKRSLFVQSYYMCSVITTFIFNFTEPYITVY